MRKFSSWIGLLLTLAASALSAQEVKVSGLVPVPLADFPADKPPTLLTAPVPAYPPAWLQDRLPRWATIGFLVKSDGTVQIADVSVENTGSLRQDLNKLAYQWRFKPGRWKGKAVAAACRATLLFNPPPSDHGEDDAAVRIISTVCTPPLSAMAEIVNPLVFQTSLLINPDGTATVLDLAPVGLPGKRAPKVQAAYGSPEVTTAIKAMLAQWRFAPAHQGGQAIAQTIRLQAWAVNDRRLDFVQPQVFSQIHPEYPYSLRASGNKGTVVMDFIVNVQGLPEKPQVVSSSHPDFERPAIAALLQWKFKPGTIGGIPTSMKMRVPVMFELRNFRSADVGLLDNTGAEPYEIRATAHPKPGDPFNYDVAPQSRLVTQPVYPFEALKAGMTGSASATWVVGPDGKVTQVVVTKASSPEFGQAYAAAIYSWQFVPAQLGGKPTSALMKQDTRFDTDERDFRLDDDTLRLLGRIKKNKPIVPQLKDLDRVPKGLYQPAPRFLSGSKPGTVQVEFYIDEKGLARFPHALSSTNADLVYPALTAIGRWQFEPPLQNGKPTAARAQIPVTLKAAAP